MAPFSASTLRINTILRVHALPVRAGVRFGVDTKLVVLLAAIPVVQLDRDWLIVLWPTQGTPFSRLGIVWLVFAVRVGSVSVRAIRTVALLRADWTHQLLAWRCSV